jgi:acetoin:2,6-dichlorophenolindophenol oxidoreductase subunit alpha
MRIRPAIEQAWFNRFFELGVAKQLDDGIVKPPVYLSIGTEHIPPMINYSMSYCYGLNPGEFYILTQHRCHSYYLSIGGDPVSLARELCGLGTGCNRGYGGSASISCKEKRMIGHSGLLGDQVPIGVGIAAASNVPTVIVLGDGAAEEDYVLGALGHAVTKQAPAIFVVEDNDLSILTRKSIRRSWSIVDVARSMGIYAQDIQDTPKEIFSAFRQAAARCETGPHLININCERERWHAGSGVDSKPTRSTLVNTSKSMSIRQEDVNKIGMDVAKIWRQVKNEAL